MRTLQVEGPKEVPPGETRTFRAVMVSSSGDREDVTDRAEWRVANNQFATVEAPGIVRGVERGETHVVVRYSGNTLSYDFLVLESGTFRLSGQVLEGGFPISGVRVVVSRGTGVGLTTTSLFDGEFRLYGVAGEIDLTATHPEHRTTTQSVTVNGPGTVDIVIEPVRPPDPLTGSWTLTIQPSPTCLNLEDVGWPRSYPVAVKQTKQAINVALRSDVCPVGCTVVLNGVVSDRSVTIDFPFGDVVDGPWLQERLPSGVLTVAGIASGSVVGDAIEGRFSGGLNFYTSTVPRQARECSRNDHSFRMTRR